MSIITRGGQSSGAANEPARIEPSDAETGSNSSAGPPTRASRFDKLRQSAAAILIFAALAGIALWGHANDWTLPKFSSLVGSPADDAEKWCAEHSVREFECIACNPALVPPEKDFGWCAAHGVAQCPLDHPEVAQLKTAASLSPERIEQADRALALLPRAENNSRCKLHQRRIQFASLAAMEKSGIDIAIAQEQPLVESIEAGGEVVYDQTGMAHLASRSAGTIYRVEKQIGDRVSKGEVLALVDAAEVGRTKGAFSQALIQMRLKRKVVERLKPLAANGAIAGAQFQEAESAFHETNVRLLAAQQSLVNFGFALRIEDFDALEAEEIAHKLRLLGIPSELANQIDSESTSSNLLPLRSSLSGIVIERDAVPGEVVDTATNLFTVADLARMHLLLNVRQEDAKYVALGQNVVFQTSDRAGEPQIKGVVAWISTAVDDRTRTVKIRAELPNADGRLRANTFGSGRIVLREEPHAVFVPNQAIHWEGCCNVVFVRDKHFFEADSPKFFHIRKVRLGVKKPETTEIIAGLLPGEVVAARNSVVIEAQLLKSNLGAGCCEVPMAKK